jgi:hypothetical protein
MDNKGVLRGWNSMEQPGGVNLLVRNIYTIKKTQKLYLKLVGILLWKYRPTQ